MHSDYVFIKTVEADFMKDFKRGGLTSMVNRLKSLYIHTYIHRAIYVLIDLCEKSKHLMMTYGKIP